jgi:ADP-heptose:LPS heptosyltransferase
VPSDPTHILVIRPGALGDTIVTEPAVAALRDAYPAARIDLAGRLDYLPLLVGPGAADECQSTDALAFTRLFADGPLDWPRRELVVAFLPDPNGTLAERLRIVADRVVVHDPRPPDDGSAHIVDHLLRAVERLGLPVRRRRPEIPATHGCACTGAAPGHPLSDAVRSRPIVLHPGSGGCRKLWPPENWAELIEHLHPNPITLTAGPADDETIAAVRDAWRERARPDGERPQVERVEQRPILEIAALLARARLYVGCDSGISHLAAAAGVPSIVVFGPTDPRTWAPRGPHVRCLRGPDGTTAAVSVRDVLRAASAAVPLQS